MLKIVIVNNDQENNLSSLLIPKTIKVNLVQSDENVGYGAGCNVGAKHSDSKFLFFLNPDTRLLNSAVSVIRENLLRDQKQVLGPTLFNESEERYPLQGTSRHSVMSFLLVESWLGSIFSWSEVYKNHFLLNQKNTASKKVSVVPGTALALSKKLFDKIGGFDEDFFLYYEEVDLCHRLEDYGADIRLLGEAHVQHTWGVSTQKEKEKNDAFFWQSRSLYLRKYFGEIRGRFLYLFCRIHWFFWIVTFSLAIGCFLHLTKDLTG